MGILDDAIKEHLELKRRHGAGESELKQLEDEAFGAAERPGGEGSAPDSPAEASTEPEAPAEEEPSAMEHEAVPEPAAPAEPAPESEPVPEPEISTGPTTEEREAIAEQPTEMYDVEEELSASQAEAPSEEDLLEEGLEEPRLAPVDPLAELDKEAEGADTEQAGEAAGTEPAVDEGEEEYEEDDDFWDEKRLSDELDQALEAPNEVEDEEEAAVFEPEPEPEAEAEGQEQPPTQTDEDVLEETPDFLEEAPEDDQLWFEQKPPKDFDFDD